MIPLIGIAPTIRAMLTALPDWILEQFNSLLDKMAGIARGIRGVEARAPAATEQMKPVRQGEEIDEISLLISPFVHKTIRIKYKFHILQL